MHVTTTLSIHLQNSNYATGLKKKNGKRKSKAIDRGIATLNLL